MAINKWNLLSSKLIINNRWLRVRQDSVELPDGTTIDDYFVRETRHVAKVFAVTKAGKVILNHQYKHGAGELIVEPPAGFVEDGEDPAKTVARELLEETGYQPGHIKKMGSFWGDPTGSNTLIHFFLATECTKVAQPENNPREVINVELVSIPKLKRYVAEGKINSEGGLAVVLMGLTMLRD